MPESKASARRAAVALRRGKAVKMRAAGATYDEIFAAMPHDPTDPHAGYRSRSALIQDIQRALMLTVAEPAADLRALEAERLDMLWRRLMQVLSRTHIAVSHGKIVYTTGPDGFESPLTDDGPVVAAARELRQLSESRRKLFGLDAPAQVQVVSDDAIDEEIKRLTAELERAAAEQAADAADAEAT